MPLNLSISIVVSLFIFILIILFLIRKNKIPVKYALIWLISVFILLVTVLIPNEMIRVADFLGFETVASMLYALMIFILLFLTLCLTIIVSTQKEKIRLLIQEVSILKKDKAKK